MSVTPSPIYSMTTNSVNSDTQLPANSNGEAQLPAPQSMTVKYTTDNTDTTDNTVTFGCTTYEGGTYIGYLHNGLPHHYGKLIYYNDIMYQGFWSHGMEHGQGTLRWYDGSHWDGEFWQGRPNGHGYYYPGNEDNPSFTELVGAEVQENSPVKIEELGEVEV